MILSMKPGTHGSSSMISLDTSDADEKFNFVNGISSSIKRSISEKFNKLNKLKNGVDMSNGNALAFVSTVHTDLLSRMTRAIYHIIPYEEILMVRDGLLGGVNQILYVVLLMFCWIYLYAVAGMMLFMKNDPWNFGTIEMSMLMLLRVATFDAWGDNFHVNYYGCDEYPAMFPTVYTNEPGDASNQDGGLAYCATPLALPVTSSVFYVSFIAGGVFGILATLINVVAYSMERSLTNHRQLQSMRTAEAGHFEELAFDRIGYMKSTIMPSRMIYESYDILERFIAGKSLHKSTDAFLRKCPEKHVYTRKYLEASAYAYRISKNYLFENLIHLAILLCAVTSYFETIDSYGDDVLKWINFAILTVFVMECFVRILSEPYPWNYLRNRWNVFDFGIVVVSFWSTNDRVLVFRTIRAIRIIKLFRRYKRLQHIVESFLSSLSSVLIVIFFTFLWMLIMAVIGWFLFGTNDPKHFDGIGTAFISVFQTMTLDGWSLLMYINMYGCDVYGYDESEKYLEECKEPSPNFVASAVYFVLVIATLEWILFNMFIGILTVSAIEVKSKIEFETRVWHKVKALIKSSSISRKEVKVLQKSFKVLDFFGRSVIGPLELNFALEKGGVNLHPDEFDRYVNISNKLH